MENQSVELQVHIETEHDGHEEVEYTETNQTQTSSFMDEDEKKFRYSKSVVDVTKKMLAKYIFINRCFCLAMVWIHFTIALISFIATYHSSVVLSESTLCRYIFYASHYFYGYIHAGIAVLYIYLIATVGFQTLDDMKNAGWPSIIFAMCCAYVIMIKVLADTNCSFWGITISQIVFQGVQFAAEGVLLKMFYTWLHSKTQRLKLALEDNIDMEKTEQYTKL